MTPLGMAYVVIAAVCVVVGVQHLVVGLRLDQRTAYLLFGAAAVVAAADSLLQYRYVSAEGPVEFERVFTWSALSICSFLILLLWFIEARTGAMRRWLLLAETGLLALTAVFDFLLPSGTFMTMDVTAVRDAVLPWGEVISEPVGEASPWRIVGDLANIGFLVLLIDTSVRLFRLGRRHEGRVIVASTLLLALSVLAIIPLDLGWIDLPPIHPFAFLLIVALMAWDLSISAARASELSLTVLANERRWRQLLDEVQLLVARVDRDGRIVALNPHFEKVLGYSIADARGREYWSIVAPELREERRAAFHQAIDGTPTRQAEVQALAKDSSVRHIVWRNVMLRDSDGEIEGMLSIGADMTEQRDAESQRDRVVTELESTVAELERVRAKLEEENVYLKEEIGSRTGHSEILGSSGALLYVLHKIQQVAATDATVLIQGETGVGKELVANAIYNESERSRGPFLAVNCAALPSSLIESELFGHERGAFTGADRRRQGRFELSNGGTLFLDEIAELPLDVQPKLLRALQEGTIERIGGNRTIEVDVRLIAATNRDLRSEVEAGRFREDLFYRLEVYPITVPPLRDRREDIGVLVRHFARDLATRHRTELIEIPPEVLRKLEVYDWPGNVRELQNVVERAVLNAKDGVLRLVSPLEARNGEQPRPDSVRNSLRTLDEVQRDHIVAVLAACGGQIAGRGGAASILGMHPNTLRSRLKKLGITPPK